MVLGALFTYQILYWSWLKLESLEKEEDNKSRSFALVGFTGTLNSSIADHSLYS